MSPPRALSCEKIHPFHFVPLFAKQTTEGCILKPEIGNLVSAVQTNCNISDARHAGDMTLCNYLLDMREFYRWEQGIAFSAIPEREKVGKWIAEREALWQDLENSEFMALHLGGRRFEPFDAPGINAVLAPHGLVYGAGIGRFGKPQFFLGELKREERRDVARILITDREYARDLSPAPAALLENTIYLRQESLRRWLWEKIETWGVRKPQGAFKETLDAYGFAEDPPGALQRMTEEESETLILHELGEIEADRYLGNAWKEMRSGIGSRRAELLVRAVRDNLADCLVTLPALLERKAGASIHFWFANFDGMRREIFPLLASAYDGWNGGNAGLLRVAIRDGQDHWRVVCRQVLALHGADPGNDGGAIESLITAEGIRL